MGTVPNASPGSNITLTAFSSGTSASLGRSTVVHQSASGGNYPSFALPVFIFQLFDFMREARASSGWFSRIATTSFISVSASKDQSHRCRPTGAFRPAAAQIRRIVGILKSDRNGTRFHQRILRSSAFAPVVFSFSWIQGMANSLFISSQNGSLRDGCTETVPTRKASKLSSNEGTIGWKPGTEYSASRVRHTARRQRSSH